MSASRAFLRALPVNILFGLFSVCLLAPASSAQITGASDLQATPTPGVGHDYIKSLAETVQPSNGQLSIRIDVPSVPFRGHPLPLAYFYNSAGVHHVIPTTPPGRAMWVTDISDTQGSGWSDTTPRITATQAIASANFPGPPPYTASCVYFTNYVFQDTAGARHAFPLQTSQSSDINSPNHCSQLTALSNNLLGGDVLYNASTTAPPIDIVPQNPPPVTVVGPDGTVYACGSLGSVGLGTSTPFYESGCGTGIDRNGNGLVPQPAISVTTTSENAPWGAFSFNQVTNSIPQASCFGINGTATGQMNVYQSINFPNNKNYVFSYDPVYGLVNQINYPTGGYVKYTWGLNPISQAVETYDYTGLVCYFGYDTPAISNRYVSFDGANIALQQDFTYSTTWSSSGVGAWTNKQTKVVTKDCARSNFNCSTAPSFTTTYNYVSAGGVAGAESAVESSVVYGDFNGNTLLTETKGWAGDGLLCDLKTLDNGLISGVFYTYTQGMVTDKKEYDYGLITSTSVCYTGFVQGKGFASAPTGVTPTRDTATSYASFAAVPDFPLTLSILDRPSSIITYQGSARLAETDYGYDQSSVTAVSPAAYSHDETNYGVGYNNRGNLTSVTQQCFNGPCSGGNPKTTFTYDENGQVLRTTDPCGNATCTDMSGATHTTTYSYADSYTVLSGGQNVAYTPTCTPNPCNTNNFPTKITDPIGHIRSFKYDYHNGQLTSSTDENSQTTAYLYNTQPANCAFLDTLARPTEIDYPDGGKTTSCYNDSAPSPTVTTSRLLNTSNQYITTVSTGDALGHVVKTTRSPDPDCSANADTTNTTYDGLGQVYTVSNAYCTTSDPTYGTTTHSHDSLGRTLQVTNPDNSTVVTSYAGRATQTQDEGNGNGTQRVTRISQVDGLGRLTSVCEVAPGPFVGSGGASSSSLIGQSGAPAACGQDISGQGFLTTYLYDVLDNLLSATQGSMPTRSFAYDSLSRLTSASNPESGSTSYTYDANGNTLTKTAPAPNQSGGTVVTSYAYDALNRLISKSYNDGKTPTATFIYDASSVFTNLTNPIGRLVESTTPSSAGGCIATFSEYDPMGRVAEQYQYTPMFSSTCSNYYRLPYTYDYLGNMTSASDGYFHGYYYAYNAASRLTGLTSSLSNSQNPATLLSGGHYNAAGQITSDTLGTSEIETYTYTKRNQLQAETTKLSATQTYAYGLTFAPNGDITAATDSVNGNWTYTYDPFNRLVGANQNNGAAVYSYVYDRFGNRWQQNGPHSMIESFTGNNTTNNNHMDGYSYDAAGNLLNDGTSTYTYDAENRIVQVAHGSTIIATYLYDADGKRVHRTGVITDTCDGTGKRDYVYDLASHWTLEVNSNGTACKTEIYAGSRHFVTNGGGTYFDHSDWLGTVRLRNSFQYPSQFETCTSLPFGDAQTCIGGDQSTIHFTGKERDAESGLDNFGARYNASSIGRFMTPDPDQAAGFDHMDDPQSWNGYAYVRDNPLNITDYDGENYRVCDAEGYNCVNLTQEQYDQYLNSIKGTDTTVDSTGRVQVQNANGSFTTVGQATYYNEKDADAAAHIAGGQLLINEFVKQVAISVALGEVGRVVGWGLEAAAASKNAGPAVKVVINWAHKLTEIRPGHLPPPGTQQEIQEAVEGAVQSGQYTTSSNGVISGTTKIEGVEVGFRGKMVGGEMRISTVFTKR